jgi:hypothetical protein
MVMKDMEECRDEGGVFQGIFTPTVQISGIISYAPAGFEGKSDVAFMSLLMVAAPFRRRGTGKDALRIIEKEICRNPSIISILSAVQINNTDAVKVLAEKWL